MAILNQPPADAGTNPTRLYQHLRDIHRDMTEMQSTIDNLKSKAEAPTPPLTHKQIMQARTALSVGGVAPLPLTGLVGTAAAAQLPAPVIGNTLADLNTRFPASEFPKGVLAIAVVSHIVYYCNVDANGVHQWTAV